MSNAGPLALIGGAEWQEGCDFDTRLLEASGGSQVLIVPTAAAYEQPLRAVDTARRWFEALGGNVTGLEVYVRREAEMPENAELVRNARFIYLSGGSPLHLQSVLKGSAVYAALVEAWESGAVVAGSSAGAMVLGDPMVDPRGGAFTLGLGMVPKLAVVPHWDRWTDDKARRLTQLAPVDVTLAEIEERTALIRWADGTWESAGVGSVTLSRAGEKVELSELSST